MPKLDEVPKLVRPFLFHGVELDWRGRDEAVGECPFCNRQKFYVNCETGQWSCHAGECGESGNISSFLRRLWEVGAESENHISTREDRILLADQRSLLQPDTLTSWGFVRCPISGEWIVPGYNKDGGISCLYAWRSIAGKYRLLPTAGLHHGIWGVLSLTRDGKGLLLPRRTKTVYLCEGIWDGMVLWETLKADKEARAAVLAVPGSHVWLPSWEILLSGRKVIIIYHSDHPRVNPSSGESRSSGLEGAKRVANALVGSALETQYLRWGDEANEGYDPNLKSGFDIRDALGGDSDINTRLAIWATLSERIQPTPDTWLIEAEEGKGEEHCDTCCSWDIVIQAAARAVKWHEGMDRALACMYATCVSTDCVGDPLWMKIVSPPSSGKTILAEALSTNKKYTRAKDTIKGLLSGYQVDKEGTKNMSPIERMRGKTLIIKDADTVLQSPNLTQILSEFRGMYDRSLRSEWKNKMSTDHERLNVTVLFCGTESLRRMDRSELGERLLDCLLLNKMDPEMEDEIALRKAYQAERDLSFRMDGTMESADSPEMTAFKKLAGGYLGYLRRHATELLTEVQMADDCHRLCVAYGTFVAFLRSRPAKGRTAHMETEQRELSFRLVSQHVRWAKCLAVVLNRKTVDEEVMRRVRQVSLDTARGVTHDIAGMLHRVGRVGLEAVSIARDVGETSQYVNGVLRFLRHIGAVESYIRVQGATQKVRWRLTPRVCTIWETVYPPAPVESVEIYSSDEDRYENLNTEDFDASIEE